MTKEYYEANKAAILAKAKEYREKKRDREKHCAYMKVWHRKRQETDPEYRARNIEYHRKYNAENRERMNAHNAVYREKNREKIREYGKLYYAKNRARRSADARAKKYGITPEILATMIESQGGECAVCEKPLPKDTGRIAVDHCHTTGDVRGLLHIGCNVAVGAYERLHKKIETYLARCSKSSKSPPPQPRSSGRSSIRRGRSTPARSSGT